MQTHDQHTIEALADTFAHILREWLTPDEFAEMRAINAEHARNGVMGICASHDYCDANEAMDAAFVRVLGRDASTSLGFGPQGTADADLRARDAAWDRAKLQFLTA